jgi:hypothetical protein
MTEIPIVFRNHGIEVGEHILTGEMLEGEVIVRTDCYDGSPLYSVSVTFLTEVAPVVDPDADLLCVVGGGVEYMVLSYATPEIAEQARRDEAERRKPWLSDGYPGPADRPLQ